MESVDKVNAAKALLFWNAYKACVEAQNIPPERSFHYVRWVKEFVQFQPEVTKPHRQLIEMHTRP